MNHKKIFCYAISTAIVICAMSFAAITFAQEATETKPVATDKADKKAGRDPFKKYEIDRKVTKATSTKLEVPTIQARIERYRGLRAELTASGLTAFWQRHGAGLTVRGIEVTSHTPAMPLMRLPAFDLTAGVARVTGLRGTKGWLSLRWRP